MGDARQAACVERNGQIAGWRQARIAAGAGWTAETGAHYFIKITISFLSSTIGLKIVWLSVRPRFPEMVRHTPAVRLFCPPDISL
ncbi:hypothetical protein [Burkholderia ubonensis]|uniref:hypothetical protein n=1 Tax=Burkholderia ubonensis TaxID=101571 RepID=UPI000A462938|nr:hypothetical protein [Burkholderia ubonensis]